MGINAGGLSNWTMDRVKINKNGRAGWDANVGTDVSSNSGAMILRNVEIAWNGCGERWQTGEPWACWAQRTGGYGDGLGTYYTGGQWLIEDSFVHHNTSDGIDLRYMDGKAGTHVIIRRTYAKANAGNQIKIRGSSTIENSVIVSECEFFEGKYYMVAADNCRAAGHSIQLVMTPNAVATLRHNTITGEGGKQIGTGEGDSTGKVQIQNNVIVGQPRWDNPSALSTLQGGTFPGAVTWSGNLIWNVKGGTCPSGSLCGQNPKLTNLSVTAFDAEPLAASPVVDKVPKMTGITSDFLLQPRPSGASSDIGAYEVQATAIGPAPTCTRAAPSLSMAGPTTAVAAGTTSSYSLVLRNNDASGCSNTTFSLARSVPSGWTGSLSTASVALAPGASANATVDVTSPVTAAAGSYGAGAGLSSSVGDAHTQSASATYTVGAPVVGAPGLTETVGTSKTSYAAGATVTMSARVLNNGLAVSGARVKFNALKPNGINTVVIKAITDSNGYAGASFVSGTGPSSIGTYQLTANASSGNLTATASSTFSVGTTTVEPAPIGAGFTDTVATSKTTYAAGETVTMSARVLNDGLAVPGASVKFNALKPNGINTVVLKATTDSNGYARASFVSGTGPSSLGTYKLAANASMGNLSATASSTFSVGTTTVEPAPIVTGFTDTVATSKSAYAAGETVTMSARVLNDGKAVNGARVQFDALKPNGINRVVMTVYTDSYGNAKASFASGTGPSSIGTYKLAANATSGALAATANSTFLVD